MLELRLTGDAKRIAAMRDAIARECRRVHLGPEHAARVALVAEQLVGGDDDEPTARRKRRGGRRHEVFVIVTVQSDATMLMVRDPRPDHAELGDRRHRLLQEHTTRWSTIAGRDGRTIWAEIAPTVEAVPAVESGPMVEVAASARSVGAGREKAYGAPGPGAPHRPARLGPGTIPTFAAPE